MKAIRWSVQLATLTALSLVLTVVEARADANSVALINATNGPTRCLYGSRGIVIWPG